MNNEAQNVDEALEYARKLQARLCSYGTRQGDNNRCDCKFLIDCNKRRDGSWGGEQTGCCEARALVIYLEHVKESKETAPDEVLKLRAMNKRWLHAFTQIKENIQAVEAAREKNELNALKNVFKTK